MVKSINTGVNSSKKTTNKQINNKNFNTNKIKKETINISNTSNKTLYNTNTCGNRYSYSTETKTNPVSNYGSTNTYSTNTYNTKTCGTTNKTNNEPIKITTIKTQTNNPYSIKTNNNTPYYTSQSYNTTNINLALSGYQYSNYYLPDLNMPLEDFLKQKNINIEDLNKQIKEAVKTKGLGTREGVLAAGTTLADFLSAYNTKLPYISSTGLSGLASGKYSELGANKNWGTQGKWWSDYGKYYYKDGMDCSGFISWALHNGGYKYNEYHSSQFENLGQKREFDSNGQAGDLLWKDGHIAIITDVNKKGYTILHETENDEINSKVEGLIYTHTNFKGEDAETQKQFTHIIDMTDYYNNPANKEN